MNFLDNAFKSLQRLNEETFDLSATDTPEELNDFLDKDSEIDTISIIDDEAETEEDIKDSYIGKVILDCNVCHSLLYKDPEEVVEEGEDVNVDEECPFCYSQSGYKVVGQVKPFVREDEEEDDGEEEEPEEAEEEETDEEEEKEEKVEESFRARRHQRRMVEACRNTRKRLGGKKPVDEFLDFGCVNAQGQTIGLGFGGGTGISNGQSSGGVDIPGIGEELEECDVQEELTPEEKERKDRIESRGVIRSRDREEYNELRKKEKGIEEACEDGKCEEGCEERKPVKESKGSSTFLSDADKMLDFKSLSKDEFLKSYSYLSEEEYDATQKAFKALDKDLVAKYEKAVAQAKKDKVEVGSDSKELVAVCKEMAKGDLKESFEKVDIETDDQHLMMDSDENGKVTITTEPKQGDEFGEEEMPDETIGEVDSDVQQEIEDNSEEGSEEEGEDELSLDDEEGEEDEVDEFDEESFDELGESYLKKVYENVNSYKTTAVKNVGKKFIVEGVISFNSGSKKGTSFVFEAVKKGRRTVLEGFNKQIARANKSFKVTCNIDNKKIACERLNYRYRSNKTLVEGFVKK